MITKKCRARKNKLPWVILIGWLLSIIPAGSEGAQVYFYRDHRGVWHFTDAPTDTRFRPFHVRGWVSAGVGSKRINPVLLQPYIKAAARTFNLDPALITAVIKAESAFDPRAVSWAGAQGLMQLMPDTAVLMEVGNIFNPRENIFGGSRYLRLMLDRFNGDLKLALAAYNIGPERIAREQKIPEVRETRLYVDRVMQYYRDFKKK